MVNDVDKNKSENDPKTVSIDDLDEKNIVPSDASNKKQFLKNKN